MPSVKHFFLPLLALGLILPGCGVDLTTGGGGYTPSGILYRVAVSPASVKLALNTIYPFIAKGYDTLGVEMGISPTWSTVGSVGTIDASATFTASTAGTGMVVAKVGTIEGAAAVTVTEGILSAIKITPPSGSVLVGQTLQFTAQGTDSKGNTVDVKPFWTSSGGAGIIDATRGLFLGVNEGSTTVSANYAGVTGGAAVTVIAVGTLSKP